MLIRNRCLRALACILAIAALACASSAVQTTKQLANGVTLYQETNTTPGAELIVNCVTVDPKVEGVAIKAALCRDVVYTTDAFKGTESIASLTGRRGAVVGINADFFPISTDTPGDPLGVCIIDGELVSEPSARHAVVAMLKDGTFIFDNPTWSASLTLSNNVSRQIDGINRTRETNQLVAYTSKFGPSTRSKYKGTEVVCTSDDLPVQCGKTVNLTVAEVRADSVNTPIPEGGMVLSAGGPAASFLAANLKPGDKLTVKFDIKSAGNVDWSQAQQAVGGRPWVLKDGKEYVDLEYEKIGTSFSKTHHPRSALGITADGKLMLVTVDGRQPGLSGGIGLPDLAALMARLGALHAINLDGGGSTTLSCRGGVINSPSGGVQRSVADALLVFADPAPMEELPKLTINIPADGITAGAITQLSLTCGDDSHALTQEQADKVVWASGNGMGFRQSAGLFDADQDSPRRDHGLLWWTAGHVRRPHRARPARQTRHQSHGGQRQSAAGEDGHQSGRQEQQRLRGQAGDGNGHRRQGRRRERCHRREGRVRGECHVGRVRDGSFDQGGLRRSDRHLAGDRPAACPTRTRPTGEYPSVIACIHNIAVSGFQICTESCTAQIPKHRNSTSL